MTALANGTGSCVNCRKAPATYLGEFCADCYVERHPDSAVARLNGHAADSGDATPDQAVTVAPPSVVTIEDFAAVEEAGADPILGEPEGLLIPEGGDVMIYGDGGAGKTTLTVDAACHLAAGEDWLGISVPQRRRVLLVESEGPRPLFRQKLKRKLAAWSGPAVDGHVMVLEEPWGQITFASPEWRSHLGTIIAAHAIDVLIAGPLTRLGMDAAGTLQDVRQFIGYVQDVRAQSGRPVTVALVHHENKGGAVSGAWEGAVDTLLHVELRGNGFTDVAVQKARWDGGRHGTTMRLAWTAGESFTLKDDRDYVAEVFSLLDDGELRTKKEIATGIKAGEKAVADVLTAHPEAIETLTGEAAKAAGRHPSSVVYRKVRSALNAPNAPSAFLGGVEGDAALLPPLKGAAASERTPAAGLEGASAPVTHLGDQAWADELAERYLDGGRE